MEPPVARALADFKKRLSILYGDRLRGVWLFGSRARGDARPDSDVDVLIVLDRGDDDSEEIERTGGLASAISLEHDLVLSRKTVSESRWLGDRSGVFENVRFESIPA